MVFLLATYICLATLVGCSAHFHEILFLTEACIKPFKDYDYRTCDPIHITIDGRLYVIPKNFKTDLASIPRPLWPIFPPQYTQFVAPAILHDYLYRCGTNINRKFADEVLYSALIIQGVSIFTAMKFYTAVRLFGSSHFSKNEQDRQSC